MFPGACPPKPPGPPGQASGVGAHRQAEVPSRALEAGWESAITSELVPPAGGEGQRSREIETLRDTLSRILVFHNHVTISELPWGLPASLPTHNPGLIRKTETCGRKGLVAENSTGWTSGPPAMKADIVPPPGPTGPAWDHQGLL